MSRGRVGRQVVRVRQRGQVALPFRHIFYREGNAEEESDRNRKVRHDRKWAARLGTNIVIECRTG